MGTVYRAWDPQHGRDVALKLPRADHAARGDLAERFVREGQHAAGIRHPHICPVYEAGVLDGRHFIAMAFIEGRTLADRLKDGPLPPRRAAEIARTLARALDCIHRAGLIHRDVSAGNVILDHPGDPILMDFGLARPADAALDPRQEWTCSGTPAYMPPELLEEDRPATDLRGDLYSLGILLYHMLTAHLPFDGPPPPPGDHAAWARIVRPSEIVAAVDPRLDALCLRAMLPRAAARYQSATEFAEALDEYLVASRRGAGSRLRLVAAWLLAAAALVAAAYLANMFLLERLFRARNDLVTEVSALEQRKDAANRALADMSLRSTISLDWKVKHQDILTGITGSPHDDPDEAEVVLTRRRWLAFLQQQPPSLIAVDAAARLALLPWPPPEKPDGDTTYWNWKPASDAASSPRRIDRHITLSPDRRLVIRGRVGPGEKHDLVRVSTSNPPFHAQLVCLTRGFRIELKDEWPGAGNSQGTDDAGFGFYCSDDSNQPYVGPHVIRVLKAEGMPADAEIDYLLHIWQPEK